MSNQVLHNRQDRGDFKLSRAFYVCKTFCLTLLGVNVFSIVVHSFANQRAALLPVADAMFSVQVRNETVTHGDCVQHPDTHRNRKS